MVTFEELKNNVGRFVCIHYINKFYSECEIVYENNNVYLMNNHYSNNNGHRNKSKYMFSILVQDQAWINQYAKSIEFINKNYELW